MAVDKYPHHKMSLVRQTFDKRICDKFEKVQNNIGVLMNFSN